VDQSKEDVLSTDEAVIELARLFLRQDQHTPCPIGETLEHSTPLSTCMPTTFDLPLPFRHTVYRAGAAFNPIYNVSRGKTVPGRVRLEPQCLQGEGHGSRHPLEVSSRLGVGLERGLDDSFASAPPTKLGPRRRARHLTSLGSRRGSWQDRGRHTAGHSGVGSSRSCRMLARRWLRLPH